MHFEEKLDMANEKNQPVKNADSTQAPFGISGYLVPTAEKKIISRQMLVHLQRTVGNSQTAALAEGENEHSSAAHDHQDHGTSNPIMQAITTPGTPLESKTRSSMERELGGNFGNVRMHVDQKAAESVQAAAFTVGNDIVVHPNHFAPGTPQAQRTLAHELTHVKQQASGPVSGSMHSTGVNVSDPSDRFEVEAERKADSVMANMHHKHGEESH